MNPTGTPPMEPIQWFATLGVNGILAGVMFYFYKHLNERFTEYVKQQNEHQQRQTTLLVEVVRENTASNTKVVTMVDAMHRRLDEDRGQGKFRADPRRLSNS